MTKRLIAPLAAAAALALVFAAPSISMAQAVDAGAGVAVVSPHGNWTLRQREEWLNNRLEKARDDGSLDTHEYDRVRANLHDIRQDEDSFRDSHDGQLTDNENNQLESRLDTVAAQIHWLHENSFQRPW